MATQNNKGTAMKQPSKPTNKSKLSVRTKPAVNLTAAPTADKHTLDEILTSSNFQPYLTAARGVKTYQSMGKLPGFNPKLAGTAIYNSLSEIAAESKYRQDRTESIALLDVLKKSIENNTLTNDHLEQLSGYTSSLMLPYWNKVKPHLSDANYRQMTLAILSNEKDFKKLYEQIASHASAKEASHFGALVKELSGKVKEGDVSGMENHYERLTSPLAAQEYIKNGHKPEEANAIISKGNAVYKSLLGSLNDSTKLEHQHYILQAVNQQFNAKVRDIDIGYIKQTINAANPVDGLVLVQTARGQQGE